MLWEIVTRGDSYTIAIVFRLNNDLMRFLVRPLWNEGIGETNCKIVCVLIIVADILVACNV